MVHKSGNSLLPKHARLNMYAYSCSLFETSADKTIKIRLDKSPGNKKQRAHITGKESDKTEGGAGKDGTKPLTPRTLIIKT